MKLYVTQPIPAIARNAETQHMMPALLGANFVSDIASVGHEFGCIKFVLKDSPVYDELFIAPANVNAYKIEEDAIESDDQATAPDIAADSEDTE